MLLGICLGIGIVTASMAVGLRELVSARRATGNSPEVDDCEHAKMAYDAFIESQKHLCREKPSS